MEQLFLFFLEFAEDRNDAEEGDSNGQNYLEYCYRDGIGTTKDEEKAFQWYLKSAEGGNEYGQYNLTKGGDGDEQNCLGESYCCKIATEKDKEKVFQLFKKLVEGDSSGQNEKAFQRFMKSAKGGNSDGQNNLGYCYLCGIGTTNDEEKAFQWHLKSAEGGNNDGQNYLGYCYLRGIGTKKDDEKAFHSGQSILGSFYQFGIGATKDEEKALQYYMKSAEGGNNIGQIFLGLYYYDFLTKDGEKAFQLFMKAAEDGDSIGQNFLVEYFYRNELGFSKIEKNFCNQICINHPNRRHNCGNLNIQNNVCPTCKLLEAICQNGRVVIMKLTIALKKLKNSQQIVSEFLIEALVNFYCRDRYVLPIMGITQDTKTKEYALTGLGDLGLCRPVDLILSSETYGKIPFEEDLDDPELAIAISMGIVQKFIREPLNVMLN
ncbi:hypothetical protein Glove_50g58 [Diversispora epigaea]|uniref:Protein kinase domain-containing protein n=1 Tax=Diversispora epigaea TaxID=1348612 RepID=A0A397JMT1_9GLOM|nr:hypothetical protein Glove_50g58 [Diversispora epigaea]